jgi:ankyrin repeat protein
MSSYQIIVINSIIALCLNQKGLPELELIDQLKAIIDKDPSAARSAIVNGRDHNRFGDGWTVLHDAACSRSPEFCQVLVEMGGGLETAKASDKFGLLPFHHACQHNNFDTAKYLYQIFPESINTPDNFGRCPLHCLR